MGILLPQKIKHTHQTLTADVKNENNKSIDIYSINISFLKKQRMMISQGKKHTITSKSSLKIVPHFLATYIFNKLNSTQKNKEITINRCSTSDLKQKPTTKNIAHTTKNNTPIKLLMDELFLDDHSYSYIRKCPHQKTPKTHLFCSS